MLARRRRPRTVIVACRPSPVRRKFFVAARRSDARDNPDHGIAVQSGRRRWWPSRSANTRSARSGRTSFA